MNKVVARSKWMRYTGQTMVGRVWGAPMHGQNICDRPLRRLFTLPRRCEASIRLRLYDSEVEESTPVRLRQTHALGELIQVNLIEADDTRNHGMPWHLARLLRRSLDKYQLPYVEWGNHGNMEHWGDKLWLQVEVRP